MKRLFLTFSLLAAVTAGARADDSLLDNAIPNKWINAVLPEKLTLDLPDYVKSDPLELAQAQMFAGGYKLSLLTLNANPNLDPAKAAAIRAQSLWTLGRVDEALAVVTDPKAASDPAVQILHARILDDTSKAQSDPATYKDFTSGKTGIARNAAGTALGHLQE